MLSGGGARGAAHIGVLEVLEELHVPVDYVVGTSMGSIIGGLYAAGYSPHEMAEVLAKADWSSILSDEPPRDELWFRRREDDAVFQVDLELGWRDGGPAIPPGLILGHNVEAFLEGLLLRVATTSDFDRLAIPFRCVATDLADGTSVVLGRGSLSDALRASMSLPGVFAPVELDGHVLVDGGVVDNVPVDVARALGADVVIAVDISTPLEDVKKLRSVFGVTNQVIGILMAQNRQRSFDSLRMEDVAIVPELGDLGTLDFERSGEAVDKGHAAAEQLRDRLARFSVGESAWIDYLARQRQYDAEPSRIRTLRLDNRSRLADDVVLAFVELVEGGKFDEESLRRTRERLAGLGLFERIDVEVAAVPGHPGEVDVVVRTVEKEWGPQYLRFGLFTNSDLQGRGEYGIGIQHTWRPVNSRGGEWRNIVRVGTSTNIRTEFYQPFDRMLRWFVAPAVEFEQENLPIIVDRQKVAVLNAEGVQVGLDVGRTLGSWGELRVGYAWVSATARPEVALPGLLPPSFDLSTAEFTTRLLADTLDSPSFPRSGIRGQAEWCFADESLGGDSRESVVEADFRRATSFGAWTLVPILEAGTTIEGEDPFIGQFFLGGFQRLSGLSPRELSGNHYGLGVLQTYYQLSPRTSRLGIATYVGGSLELGGIWPTLDEVSASDLLLGGSVFLGADTLIGPIYFGFGLTEGGNRTAYVSIGPVF